MKTYGGMEVTPTIMTDVLRGFPESLQANVMTVLQIGHDRFLLNLSSSSLINILITRRYIVLMLTKPLNKKLNKQTELDCRQSLQPNSRISRCLFLPNPYLFAIRELLLTSFDAI
jgi:hypothetical protein